MAQVQDEATIIQAIVVQYMNMEIRSEILIDPTKRETQIEKSETTRLNHQNAEISEIH